MSSLRIPRWTPSASAILRLKLLLVLGVLTLACVLVSVAGPASVSYGLLALACAIECARLPWAIMDFVSLIASVLTLGGFYLFANWGILLVSKRWERWSRGARSALAIAALVVAGSCLWLMTMSQEIAGQVFPEAKAHIWRRIVEGTRGPG